MSCSALSDAEDPLSVLVPMLQSAMESREAVDQLTGTRAHSHSNAELTSVFAADGPAE